MDTPSPRYIISRAIFFIVAVVVLLYGMRFYEKWTRQREVVAELKSISSDSSYFHQFYAVDAQKSLIRAVGLIAEANKLGIPPETSIARANGTEQKTFVSDADLADTPLKTQIVIASLRLNYENFLKLGYQADYQTLLDLDSGKLPTIPSGPAAGQTPVIGTIIDPAVSPGIEKILANLEIRPPQEAGRVKTDLEVSMAKRLAGDLSEAGIIEEPVRNKIIDSLTEAPAEKQAP